MSVVAGPTAPLSMLNIEFVSLNELGDPLPEEEPRALRRLWRRWRRTKRKRSKPSRANTTNPTAVNTPATAPLLDKKPVFLLVRSETVVGVSVAAGWLVVDAAAASIEDVAEAEVVEVVWLLVIIYVSGEPVTVNTETVTWGDVEAELVVDLVVELELDFELELELEDTEEEEADVDVDVEVDVLETVDEEVYVVEDDDV